MVELLGDIDKDAAGDGLVPFRHTPPARVANACAVPGQPLPPGRRQPGNVRGSATVEFVALVPFVLLLVATFWDLREFIGYRTDLAREMYIVSEAIANDPAGTSPFEHALGQVKNRFEESSVSGAIRGAVVVRGTQRADGTACPDGAWCPPRVAAVWPGTADPSAGSWSRDGHTACAAAGDAMPTVGTHFPADRTVLQGENRDPDGDGPLTATPASAWISRNISSDAWWVVVDICIEPKPGLFIGRLKNLSEPLMGTPFLWRRRIAWPSIHDRADCEWCS